VGDVVGIGQNNIEAEDAARQHRRDGAGSASQD